MTRTATNAATTATCAPLILNPREAPDPLLVLLNGAAPVLSLFCAPVGDPPGPSVAPVAAAVSPLLAVFAIGATAADSVLLDDEAGTTTTGLTPPVVIGDAVDAVLMACGMMVTVVGADAVSVEAADEGPMRMVAGRGEVSDGRASAAGGGEEVEGGEEEEDDDVRVRVICDVEVVVMVVVGEVVC